MFNRLRLDIPHSRFAKITIILDDIARVPIASLNRTEAEEVPKERLVTIGDSQTL